MIVGKKSQNESIDHWKEEAKQTKFGDKTIQTNLGGGGLALLWKADEVTIDTQTYSPNHIDVKVHTYDSLWRLTGIYEHLEEELKGETWRLMRHLHA